MLVAIDLCCVTMTVNYGIGFNHFNVASRFCCLEVNMSLMEIKKILELSNRFGNGLNKQVDDGGSF